MQRKSVYLPKYQQGKNNFEVFGVLDVQRGPDERDRYVTVYSRSGRGNREVEGGRIVNMRSVVNNDGSRGQRSTLHHAFKRFPSELFYKGRVESRRGRGQIGGGINRKRASLKEGGKRFKIECVTGSKPKFKR